MIKENIIELLKKYSGEIDPNVINLSPIGGMTNNNYLIETLSGKYIFKLFGKGTDKLIDRNKEKKNQQIVKRIGVDAENFIFDIDYGFKVNQYIDDAETYNKNTIKYHLDDIANVLKIVHSSDEKFYSSFDVFFEIEKYENLIKNGINYLYYEKIKEKIFCFKGILNNIGLQSKTCHIDLVPENFIKDKNKTYLIDWEYCAMNDPMWDVAALFLESELTKYQEGVFLSEYHSEITPINFQKILIFKILQDFLWSLWTIYKEEQGSDFGSYGIDRYNRALKNLKEYITTYEKK